MGLTRFNMKFNFFFSSLLFYLTFSTKSIGQTNIKDLYIQSNYQSIEIDTKVDCNLIKYANLDDYKVFFIGEWHNLEGNDLINFQMLKYLYYKQGLRILVFEWPISIEYFLNRCIQFGDSIAYKQVLSVSEKEYYATILMEIYSFNKTLPESERIIAKAIDRESNPNISILALKKLIPENIVIPKELKVLEILSNAQCLEADIHSLWYSMEDYKKMASTLKKSIIKEHITYKALLGENFNEFKKIVDGFYQGMHNHNKKYNDDKRELFMYNNYKDLLLEYPNAKFMGQFGKAHTSINPVSKWMFVQKYTSVASMLNNNDNSPVKGKVCSFVMNYPKYKNDINAITPETDIPLFMKYCKTDFTLFKIDGPNTPFKELSKIYQYLIINNLPQPE